MLIDEHNVAATFFMPDFRKYLYDVGEWDSTENLTANVIKIWIQTSKELKDPFLVDHLLYHQAIFRELPREVIEQVALMPKASQGVVLSD